MTNTKTTKGNLEEELDRARRLIDQMEQRLAEQKKIHAHLHQIEERFRSFMDNVSDECYETDLRGNITYINEIAAVRNGYRRDDLIGKNNRDYTSPEEAKRIYKIFREIYRTATPGVITDYKLRTRNGQFRFVETSVSLIRDRAGNPTGFCGISRDLTGRRQDQTNLERYRDFMENIADGCFENDLQETITYANEIAARRIGYRRDEFIGMSNRDYMKPEEARRVAGIFNRLYRTGIPTFIDETEVLHKDGHTVFIEQSAVVIRNEKGGIIGFRGTTRDITERKKIQDALKSSEAKYRFLTEKMADIVWTVDRNLNVTYVSSSVQTALGYPPEAFDRIGAEDVLTEESFRQVMELIVRELAIDREPACTPDRSVAFETAYRHQNGATFWFHNVASAIRDERDMITGFHGVSRNISDQKKAAAERETLIEVLRQALAEVKTLSGMLPICAHCKKIRDDQGYWNQMETYITKHSEALFSHCICPDCASRLYPDYLPGQKK